MISFKFSVLEYKSVGCLPCNNLIPWGLCTPNWWELARKGRAAKWQPFYSSSLLPVPPHFLNHWLPMCENFQLHSALQSQERRTRWNWVCNTTKDALHFWNVCCEPCIMAAPHITSGDDGSIDQFFQIPGKVCASGRKKNHCSCWKVNRLEF